LQISKGSQAIRFTKKPGIRKFRKGRKFPLDASSTFGPGITLASSNPRILCIQNRTAIIRAKGTMIVTASQHGDDEYEPAAKVARRILTR